MNKRNKNILMLIGGITALVLILIISSLVPRRTLVGKTKIITDRNEYKTGDILKVEIKNGLKTGICFSSCYPYYFEKKDGTWKSFQYMTCPKEDLVEKCADSRQVKAFELSLSNVNKGIYRLAIPTCVGCNLQDKFRKDKWFYSNEFILK